MSSGLSQNTHAPQSGKSISNAKTFQAGNGNLVDMVIRPAVNSAAKIASAGYEARQTVRKAREEAAHNQANEQAKAHTDPTPTKVMPVDNRAEGNAMRATVRANNIRRNIASAKAAPVQGRPAAGGTSRPTSLEQVPHYAVGQAMRPQRQKEVHRALSSLQYKTQD